MCIKHDIVTDDIFNHRGIIQCIMFAKNSYDLRVQLADIISDILEITLVLSVNLGAKYIPNSYGNSLFHCNHSHNLYQ